MPYEKLKSENYVNFGGINAKASQYLTQHSQVLDLINYDFSTPGAWTKRPGTTQLFGATFTGSVNTFYEFVRLEGTSFLITSANTSVYAANMSAAPIAIRAGLSNNGIFTPVTFVDYLFMSNGTDMFKFDGNRSTFYTLPSGPTLSASNLFGSTLSGTFPNIGGATGFYYFGIGFLNDRGYYGPVLSSIGVSLGANWQMAIANYVVPDGYGITAVAFYQSDANLTTLFHITDFPVFPGLQIVSPLIGNPNVFPFGDVAPITIDGTSLAPNAIELYNNQLFLLGVSNSTVYFSEIGEPESIGSTTFFEVRTNDGDSVVGGKSYLGNLIIGKHHSVHQLSGVDPTSYILSEISDRYGLISKRAIDIYNNVCWFLDPKGICQFDGSNLEIVSTPMEPYFKRMNIQAAEQWAIIKHVKMRNEMWCALPVDGATMNNLVIVYDYVAQAWTKFQGFNPASLNIFLAPRHSERVGFGDYNGAVNYLGSSALVGDNQSGITTSVTTRFVNDTGNTVEKLFRRLWLDVSTQPGVTYNYQVGMLLDHAATASTFMPMLLSQFQNRLEFGFAAKAFALQLVNSDPFPQQINGFGLAYRYLRDV